MVDVVCKIAVLCVEKDSVYKVIPGIDAWDKERDAYNFKGSEPVITHAPCQQWSRLRKFAKQNDYEKNLAEFCYKKVQENGGVFEHPAQSSFFKEFSVDMRKVISVDQSDFGFPAKKTTWLYVNGYKLPASPLRSEVRLLTTVPKMARKDRSRTTIEFAIWLIDIIKGNGLY